MIMAFTWKIAAWTVTFMRKFTKIKKYMVILSLEFSIVRKVVKNQYININSILYIKYSIVLK